MTIWLDFENFPRLDDPLGAPCTNQCDIVINIDYLPRNVKFFLGGQSFPKTVTPAFAAETCGAIYE